MAPLFIGAVTFGLKKLITKAVETPSSITRKDNIEERDAYMADVLDTYFIPDDDQRLNAWDMQSTVIDDGSSVCC